MNTSRSLGPRGLRALEAGRRFASLEPLERRILLSASPGAEQPLEKPSADAADHLLPLSAVAVSGDVTSSNVQLDPRPLRAE